MKPEKGEIMLTTGLFDPIVSSKPVKFIEEIKKRGCPTKWRVELIKPILGTDELIATPYSFFYLGEGKTLPEWAKNQLEKLNKDRKPIIECCSKYDTKFCPECGKMLG